MLFCLLEQIGEMPPQDFLANAQVKAARENVRREQLGALAGFGAVKGRVKRREDGN